MRRFLATKTLAVSVLLFISLLFVGKFFYAQAQTISPDITLESVSLSGDTAVVYRNDGAAISGQPYVISFQWVDASGTGLAPKQTLTRNTLAARGRESLSWNTSAVEGIVIVREQRCYQTGGFFSRRTQCDYIQVPRNTTQALAAYRAARPQPDALLAVTLDDGNRIAESNEGNNSARVGDVPFRGALPAPVAELVITRATFDGVFLFVVFQNQSAVNISNQPFDVGLQWLDKNGSAVGDRRFFRYKNLASGKVEIIDSKVFLTTLSQVGPGLNDVATAEPLPMYLLRRPGNAAKLSITIDDRNQILEITKANNVAVIDLPNPDLLILDQRLTPQELSFKYVNAGAAPLVGSSPLSFWFEWVDVKGTRVGDHLYWFNRDAVSLRQNVPVAFTSNGVAVYSSRGMLPMNQVLQNPPAEASALKVTIDGPNVFAEFSETNNSVVLPKPVVPLPDLTITKQVQILNSQRLVFSYINASAVPLTQFPTLSFWFEWVDGSGARVGDLYWQDRSASSALPGVTNIYNSAGVYVYTSSGAFASLDSLFRDPPTTATHLKITIDGSNKFRETNENNNSVLLLKPASAPEDVVLPDLALTAVDRAGGVVKVTIVNGTPDTITTPLLQFKWLDAKGAVLTISPVSFWSGANIAPGKTGEFVIEYEKWREDGVTRFLKQPPADTVALVATIDPENKLKESNEDNNKAEVKVSLPVVQNLPDLTIDSVNVKDGYVRIVVKNTGSKASGPTDIWLMWFAESRALSVSAAVSLPDLPPLSTVVVPVSLDKKIEQTEAARILQDPPKDGTRLRIYLDGSRRVTEANEDNNDAFFDRAALPKLAETVALPDLAFNAVHMAGKDTGKEFLVVSMKNAGKISTGEFVWQMRWLDRANSAVGQTYRNIHEGLQPNWNIGATSDAQDKTGKPVSMKDFVSNPPEGAVLLEVLLDPDNRVVELNEQNNSATIPASALAPLLKVQKTVPVLDLTLSVETISSSSAAGAAANSVATGGLFLALLTFLGGGLLIYSHNGTPGNWRDLVGVFPLVFASPETSYMRLQECGPEGCQGKHFARHRALKYVAKGSLVAAVSAGALKLVIATALATLLPASQTLLAEGKEVYPGDKLRATLVVKNIGQSKATDLVLTLPCPTGTFWASTILSNQEDKRNADNGMQVADLDVSKSHQLAIVCQVKDSVTAQQKLKFVGTANAKGAERVFQSNAVELQARPRLEPEKPVEPELLPDLTVEGLGLVSEKVVGGANLPFKATFTGVVQNNKDKPAPASRARLRIDIGANGTWDNLGAGLFDVPALDPDSTSVAKWDVSWNAPLGLYAFEVCIDTDNKVKESSEKNNCLTDRFTLQKGEEPMFEESEDLLE